MLQFLKYKKVYGKELILELPDLFLAEKLYWIKGKNGSGKSTLLKSIAGLTPFSGEIKVCGISNNEKNLMHYRKLVSYAPSEPLYPEFLKASDLIPFSQNLRKATQQQVEYLLELFKIKDFYFKKIGTYSSGMIKKLSLALAFIGNPKLILLDEPLITLDKEALIALVSLVNESINKGVTIIFTSHQEELDESNFLPASILKVENKNLIQVNKC